MSLTSRLHSPRRTLCHVFARRNLWALLLAAPAAWATTTINHQFTPATINPGDTSAYRITITNDDTGSALTAARVTVALQPQITVAGPLAITNTCGFTVNQPLTAGSSTIELTDGTIAAGATGVPSECYFEVNVTATAAGNWINTIPANPVNPPFPPGTPTLIPDAATSGYLATTAATGVYVANSTSANATLSVNSLSPLTGSKVFSPSPAYAGNPVTLTITLSNPNAGTHIPLTTFTDTLPDDGNGHAMQVSGTPTVSCTGNNAANGTIAAAGDNKSVTLTGGAIGEGGSCVLTVPVTVASINGISQSFTNTVAADAVGNSRGLGSAGFSRALTINTPIQIQKSFATSPVPVGQPSLMTLTVTNHGSVNALDIASFGDDLTGTTLKVLNTASTPVAVTANPSVSCTGAGAANGTLATTPNTLDTAITLSNAVAGPGGHCTITAYVTSDIDGSHPNTTSTVSNPAHNFDSTPASAPLTAKGQLVVLKTVSVANVAPGQWTEFIVTIQNYTGVQVDNVHFRDLLPHNGSNQMVVFDPAGTTSGIYTTTGCNGGTWTGLDATGTSTGSAPVSGVDAGLQWSGGSIAAGVGATPGVCTIRIRSQLPATAASGLTFTNQIPLDSVTAERSDDHVAVSNPDSQPAANVVSVDAVALTKSFSGTSIAQGGLSTLTITVYNRYTSALTGIGFTDTLPAGIALAANPSPSNDCGGSLQAYPGAGQIVLSGASLAARPDGSQQTTCSVTVRVTGNAVGSFQNIIHPADFTSTGGTLSANATATLNVTTGITGSKSFSPTAVTPGGVARATITINNVSSEQLTNLSVNDDGFGANLSVANPANATTSCGGSPTLVANPGAASVQMQGAVLNAGASCTLSFDVTTAPASSGPWSNTVAIGRITSAEGPTNTAAFSATLTANTASITINKSFSPVVVTGGQPSVLSIDVVNNSNVAIHDVGFTDTFPTGIQVYAVPGASTTCAGGHVTAIPGDGKVMLAGATLAANSTCHVYVTTTSVKFLNLTNTIPAHSVSSAEGYSNPLATSASLSTLQGLGVMKAFAPAYIAAGQTSRLQITLVSTFDPNAVSPTVLTGVSFTDTLPAGVTIAATPNASTTCSDGSGGYATVMPAAAAVTLAGAVIAPGSTCLVEVDVTAASVGSYDNTIAKFGVTTTQGVSNQNAATARLNVVTQPTIAKSFAASTVRIGQATRLTVTISNGSGVALSGIALTDTLPAGLAIANTPNAGTTCSNAVVDATAGGDTLAVAGAALNAGSNCTFYADVVANVAGSYANNIATGSLSDDQGLTNPGPASATLTVLPPASVSKRFSPVQIQSSGTPAQTTSTLTITLANSSASSITLTSDLIDALPGQVVVAGTPNVGGTCTGTKSADAGGTTITYASGSSIPAGSCTITVDVTSATSGTYTNVIAAGQLQTSAGNNQDPAIATLGVDQAVPPTMDKAFAPTTILAGGTSTLTINLHNDNLAALTLASDFTDNLPANLSVQGTPTTTCGGTLSFTATSLTLQSGATLPAGGCTITASVTSATAGSYTNTIATSALVTDAGSPPLPAVAGLVIEALTPPTVLKAFAPNVINPGGVSTLTITLDNANATAITLTSALTDTLPTNVVVAPVPNLGGTCAGTKTADAGTATITYADTSVIPAGGCTIVVDVTSTVSGGPYTNTIAAGSLQTTAGSNGADATASLFVNPAQPPSISKSFSPSSIPKNGTATLTLSLGNGNAAATTLTADFIDHLPANLVIAAVPNVQTTCPGSITATAGGTTITYANGSTLPAGGCSISLAVTAALAATYTNAIAAGDLVTGYGANSVGTSADLQVLEWPVNTDLVTTKAASPTSGVADSTITITLTWRNANSATPTRNAYQCVMSDPLPAAAFDATTVTPITTPSGYTYSLVGNTVSYTRTDTTTPCETTAQTARFSVKLKAGVVTGTTYTNTATVTAKTLPANDPNAAAAATLTRNATANVTVTAPSASGKTAIASSQGATDSGDANINANPPVAIGETVTYTMNFALPPGTTNAVTLADEITTGIADVSLVSATLSRSSTNLTTTVNPGGINTAGASVPVDVTSLYTTSGNEFRFALGNTTNADAANATLTLTVTLRIANVATNIAGHTITDQGRLRYQNAGGTNLSVVTGTRSVHVALPVVALTKTAAPAAPAGGDPVTYTLTITNSAAGGNATDGYDWTFSDPLPATLTNPGSFAIVSNPNGRSITGTFSGNTLNGTIDRLVPGESVQVSYIATVATTTAVGSTITNSATARATSIPSPSGDEVGERDGSGGVNNLSATATASVTTSLPSMTKSVLNARTYYAIGDQVSYRLAIAVPGGATPNFIATDVLPAGLDYVTGSATVSSSAGVTASNAGAIVPTIAGSALDFAVGDIAASNAGTVYLDFNARVTNIRSNEQGAALVNSASATYGVAQTIASINAPAIQIGEPNLTATKTVVSGATGSDAGNTVRWQATISNAANRVTAYQVTVRDQLPDHLYNISVVSVTSSGGNVQANNAGCSSGTAVTAADAVVSTTANSHDTLTLANLCIEPGAALTIVYDATLMNTAIAGETLSNTIAATYASQPTGSSGSAEVRDGADAGTDDDSYPAAGSCDGNTVRCNNYNESASSSLTVGAAIAIDKQADKTLAAIGETVAYTIRISVIEGVTPGVVVTDVLPAGLSYVSHAINLGNMGMSLGNASYNTRLGGGQTVQFNLGDVADAANASTADDYVDVVITARVDNILANQRGTVLRNGEGTGSASETPTATVSFGGASGGTLGYDYDAATPGYQGRPLTVIEPALTLTKAAVPPTQALGDEIVYTLTIRHDGANSDATARDIDVSDVLPNGLSYIAGSATPSEPTVVGKTLRFPTLSSLTTAAGSTTITYRVRVDLDAAVATPLVNRAAMTWKSTNGATGTADSGRTGPSTDADTLNDYRSTATATVTTNVNAIYATKTVALIDTAGDGIVNGGDTLEYTVVLHNGSQAVTGVVFTDPIPVNTAYVAGSLSLNGGSVANGGTASQLRLAVGSLAAGATATITFRVTVNAGVVAGAVISNQGQVDSDQTVPTPTDGDGNPDNGAQPTIIDVGLPTGPSLSVVKTVAMTADPIAPAGSINVGDEVTYTLVLTNTGSVALTNLALADNVPAAVTITGVSANANWTGGASVGATIASLAPGAAVAFTITGNVNTAGTHDNQASVTSNELPAVLSDADGDPDNGVTPTRFIATEENVVGAPLLTLHKTGQVVQQTQPDGLLHTNDVVEYSLVLRNVGSAAATAVVLTDPLPVGTSYVTASTSQGSIVGTAPLSINVGTVVPGETVTVSLQVRVTAGIGASIVNTGSFACAETGCPGDSNTVVMPVTAPNVFLPPIGTKKVTAVRSDLTWRMVWINSNNTSANRVRVVDPLPSELTFQAGSLTCEARGSSTVTTCTYDAASRQVIYEGSVGADLGQVTEDTAANEIVVTFTTILDARSQRTSNTALAYWDGNGNGLVVDDTQAGQVGIEVDASYQRPVTSVPTLDTRALTLLAMLLVWLGAGGIHRRR